MSFFFSNATPESAMPSSMAVVPPSGTVDPVAPENVNDGFAPPDDGSCESKRQENAVVSRLGFVLEIVPIPRILKNPRVSVTIMSLPKSNVKPPTLHKAGVSVDGIKTHGLPIVTDVPGNIPENDPEAAAPVTTLPQPVTVVEVLTEVPFIVSVPLIVMFPVIGTA